MADPGSRKMAQSVEVEFTREEFGFLIVHVETQLGELRQALGNLEEEEGESVPKWNMARGIRKQVEMLEDLTLKMQGVAKDAGWR